MHASEKFSQVGMIGFISQYKKKKGKKKRRKSRIKRILSSEKRGVVYNNYVTDGCVWSRRQAQTIGKRNKGGG